jgi:hypothetical protein
VTCTRESSSSLNWNSDSSFIQSHFYQLYPRTNLRSRLQPLSLYFTKHNNFLTIADAILLIGGVESKLGPFGMSASNWPIVLAPSDFEDEEFGGIWMGKPKYSEKTCPSATLSTTNPTSPDAGSNPGRRGGKPTNNRLSYGAAYPTL